MTLLLLEYMACHVAVVGPEIEFWTDIICVLSTKLARAPFMM